MSSRCQPSPSAWPLWTRDATATYTIRSASRTRYGNWSAVAVRLHADRGDTRGISHGSSPSGQAGTEASFACSLTGWPNLTDPPDFETKQHAVQPGPLSWHDAQHGVFVTKGLPVPDVGTALPVSFQRAKQLIGKADKAAR